MRNAESFVVLDALLRASITRATTANDRIVLDTQLAMLNLIRELSAEIETLRIVADRYDENHRRLEDRVIQLQQMLSSLSQPDTDHC